MIDVGCESQLNTISERLLYKYCLLYTSSKLFLYLHNSISRYTQSKQMTLYGNMIIVCIFCHGVKWQVEMEVHVFITQYKTCTSFEIMSYTDIINVTTCRSPVINLRL